MKLLSRKTRLGRKSERGATLTGYGLLMAGIVVVSLGAIEAVNQSSQRVIEDTATSVGEPRESVSLTKTQDVGALPSWVGERGNGVCTAGIDGCALGTQQIPYTPQAVVPPHGPLLDPDLSNTTTGSPGGPADIYLLQESEVVMNTVWTPPNGDTAGATPVQVLPGEHVCSFIVHVSSLGSPATEFVGNFEFGGEIIGTAFDTKTTSHRLETNDTFASSDLILPPKALLGNSDKFTYSGNTLSINPFKTSGGGKDNLRVFTRC